MLDTRQGIRKGGDTGPAVVPGDLAGSLLVEALHYHNKDLQMPPEKSGGKLPDDVIADFEQWIKISAPTSREATAVATATKPSWDVEKAKNHWAFKAPQPQTVPAVHDTTWPHSDIDRFLLAPLEAKDLHPACPTPRPKRCSAASISTCTGLPPTPQGSGSLQRARVRQRL